MVDEDRLGVQPLLPLDACLRGVPDFLQPTASSLRWNRRSETPPVPIELSARREWIVPVAVALADAAALAVDAKLTAGLLRKIATARDRFALRWEYSRCSFATRAAGSPTAG